MGKPRLYEDKEELRRVIDAWKAWIANATIRVEVPKPDKHGGCIVQTKPEPVTIESFLQYAKVSSVTFMEWSSNTAYSEYANFAREIRDFVTSHMVRNSLLGYNTDKMGIFYLVNTSTYKDVSEIITETTTKVLPAWMTGARVQINDKEDGPKALPHESLDFTDIPHATVTPEKKEDYDFL